MKFLITIRVKSPITGAFEPLVVHEVDFDENVTALQAATALVEIERELTREYVRVNIEGVQEDEKEKEANGNHKGND